MNYNCPTCKSDNIQRLSVIFTGGISNINTTNTGVGLGLGRGGIGVGLGSGKTRGVSQTAASSNAAPPTRSRYIKPLLYIFLAYFVLSGLTLGLQSRLVEIMLLIGWIGFSIWWIVKARQYNIKTWPPLMTTWNNTYRCNRCNATFCYDNQSD